MRHDDNDGTRPPHAGRGGRGVRLAWLVAAGLVVTAGPALAQSAAERRLLIGTSGGVQFVKDAFMNEVDFTLFQEGGKFASSYDITTDTAFDASIALRAWKRMGVGMEVSHFYKLTTAVIEAEVPHPFFFSFPRMTTGLAGGVTRREVAVHLQAQYWHGFGDDILVRGFAGPTFFDVSHDLVSAIETRERGFDFSEVDVVGHETEKADESAVGFHVGLDVSYFGLRHLRFLGRSGALDHVGLAFVLRYSRGTAGVQVLGSAQPSLELGGTHLGGGLRVVF